MDKGEKEGKGEHWAHAGQGESGSTATVSVTSEATYQLYEPDK